MTPWNLVADIGGTNARFGLADSRGALLFRAHYSVADHPDFTGALMAFLRTVAAQGGWQPQPDVSCFAVACPPDGEALRFTNSPWTLHRRQLAGLLGHNPVHVINDFAAVGHGVTNLLPGDWRQIGGGDGEPARPIAVLGPGTGLGVCALVPVESGYGVVSGEGGHVDFAPNGPREIAILEVLAAEFGHVSVERLLSGAGIVNLYRALTTLAGDAAGEHSPAEITAAALAGRDPRAVEALALFCRILGAVAGNLALTLGAMGGVYIAGGILPRFVDFAAQHGLRQGFEAKGRFQSYLAAIPLRVITRTDLGLHGAAAMLARRPRADR